VAVGSDAVSTYIGGLDGALADRFAGYRGHLETQPLAAHTRRTYAGQVGDYLSWLAEFDQPAAGRATRSPTGPPGTTPSGTTAPTSSASGGPSPPRSTSPWPRSTTSAASSGSAPPTPAAKSCPSSPPGR